MRRSPATLRGRLPKPMKARRMQIAPRIPVDEVRVLDLEDQPVEADREQDEGDVGVGEQVEEPLEGVHRDLDRGRRRPSRG